MPKILIIEDDADMAMGLRDNLSFEGYEPAIASDGEEGLKRALREHLDLILLDIMLPRMDGFRVCEELRSHGIDIPIIILTVKGQESDKVQGLELGADDYITKPFSLKELLARVRAVLRRSSVGTEEVPFYQFGDVVIDFRKRVTTKRGGTVELSAREVDMMALFIRNEGQVISREQFLEEIWGYEVLPTTRTVDAHVASLRRKLEDRPEEPRHILTVHGAGYKFVG